MMHIWADQEEVNDPNAGGDILLPVLFEKVDE